MANYTFTYNQEIGHQGQSLVPHFPGGKSGVTIGPGYDMGHRSPSEIYSDLTNAGIDPETAYSLIGAAHKTGPEAGNWLSQKGGIMITEEQQRSLFENVLVPEYEERTKNQLISFARNNEGFSAEEVNWDNLSEKQQQILFDYVYNTGGLSGHPELTAAVLHEDWDEVALHYERFSGEQPLTYRNEMFYAQFLDPDYREDSDYTSDDDAQTAIPEALLTEDIEDLYSETRDDPHADREDADEWYENS